MKFAQLSKGMNIQYEMLMDDMHYKATSII